MTQFFGKTEQGGGSEGLSSLFLAPTIDRLTASLDRYLCWIVRSVWKRLHEYLILYGWSIPRREIV